MPEWLRLTIAAVSGSGIAAGLVALWLAPGQDRKNRADSRRADAEAGQVVAEAAVLLLQPLQDRVDELEGRVRELVDEVDAYRSRYGPLNPGPRPHTAD